MNQNKKMGESMYQRLNVVQIEKQKQLDENCLSMISAAKRDILRRMPRLREWPKTTHRLKMLSWY